jgi:hypothetical protein
MHLAFLAEGGFTTGDLGFLLSGRKECPGARTAFRRGGASLRAAFWRRSLGHWKFSEKALFHPHDPAWRLRVAFIKDEPRRPVSRGSVKISFRGRHPRIAEVPSRHRQRRLIELFTRAAS